MTLRRKILLSFIMLTLISGIVTLSILEAIYLSGDSFRPGEGSRIVAPGLGLVAMSMAIGAGVVAYLLYLTFQRLVIDPIMEIIHASTLLSTGEYVAVRSASRNDEMGTLAETFNIMAENVIEARTHLEEKIRAATEQIEHTQRELAFSERLAATGRLAAGVAHEINNPLGGVMNAVARLRKGNLTPERSEKYLDICDDGLKRIQETVRRILDFSRKRPERGPVNVTEPLMQSVELVRHLLAPANIELKMDLAPDGDDSGLLKVSADPRDLQHVCLNLLMNAIDAMPDGGVLTVRARRDLPWVRMEIEDTGVGLTPEELSVSFDYFHTTKPVGKGTGLGLSIAHHIVAGYNGALTLTSEKGRGTLAVVELPALGESLTRIMARAQRGAAANEGSGNDTGENMR